MAPGAADQHGWSTAAPHGVILISISRPIIEEDEMTASAEGLGEGDRGCLRGVDLTGRIGVQVGDGTIQHNNYYIQEARFLQEPAVRDLGRVAWIFGVGWCRSG